MEAVATRREYRAALVFYGGVSLAIYENGVARAFHDAARNKGVFAPLMSLLGGRFVVDVISGSSAGGINGLMLAAALESGTDFKVTAGLWREAGGIDALLRKPEPGRDAPSLLNGETYYIGKLRESFRKLCATRDGEHAPKEIDVFVTGTDMTGQSNHFVDAGGSDIETMSHSLVFHLKHRRDRSRMGVSAADEEASPILRTVHDAPLREEQRFLQADILASVARITSSFPAAFPPFTPLELDSRKMTGSPVETPRLVGEALERLSGATLAERGEGGSVTRYHALVDGGVLDNKPFGPVLHAIFQRMPSEEGLFVDRKLFYIEPDPERFPCETDFSPLQVIFKSVVSLPMYDSIAPDVRRLEEHNTRVRLFKAMRKNARRAILSEDTRYASGGRNLAYRTALLQSIGCALLGVDGTEVEVATGLEALLPVLDGIPMPGLRDVGDDSRQLPEQWMDIGFHLRRAYDVLYDEIPREPDTIPKRRYAAGRIIKALKLLRDVWLAEIVHFQRKHPEHPLSLRALRKMRLAGAPEEILKNPVSLRLRLLYEYLNADWIGEKGEATPTAEGVAGEKNGEAAGPSDELDLSSEALSDLRDRAVSWLKKRLEEPSRQDGAPPWGRGETGFKRPRALVKLAEMREGLLHESRFELFAAVDACVYSAEMAGGLYELDQVELARISPRDADLPSPSENGREKITGDALGHFSAFLRRDWRTNDIAWGHSDALCRIIKVLLSSETAWQDIAAQLAGPDRPEISEQFSRKKLLTAFCEELGLIETDESPRGLSEACGWVEETFQVLATDTSDTKSRELFRTALTKAAQLAAMCEYAGTIAEDAEEQNAQWRWKEGPSRRLDPKLDAMAQVTALKLGDKAISEEVPASLVVEYVSRSGLLLMGMLGLSVKRGGHGERILERIRGWLAPLFSLGCFIGRKFRTEKPVAAALILALFSGCVAFGIGGAVSSSAWTAFIGFALAFVFTKVMSGLPSLGKWLVVGGILFATLTLLSTALGRELIIWVGGLLVSSGEILIDATRWAEGLVKELLPNG